MIQLTFVAPLVVLALYFLFNVVFKFLLNRYRKKKLQADRKELLPWEKNNDDDDRNNYT